MAYGYRLWEDAIELNSSVYILDHCNNLQDLDQYSVFSSVVKIAIPRPINRQKSLIGVFPTNFPQIGQLIASRSTTVKIGPNRS
ncbi:hypothetical protein R6Q59_014761 [Mikania micrantha]